MSTEEPHVETPVEPAALPPQPSAAVPPTAPPDAEIIQAAPRGPSTNVILIAVGVIAVIALGVFYLVQHPGVFGGSNQATTIAVQPYAPAQAMMTANDRVTAYSRPDVASPPVVVFGQGVALTITGRVSRGLGDDWFAVTWNNQQAFVRAADAVVGNGAPPPMGEHQRQEPRVKPDEEDEPNVADNEFPALPEEPSSSLGREISNPDWIRAPGARDFARFYPDRALEQGRSGRVVLDCVADAGGRLDCSIASEEPRGQGFGRAALSIARQARLQPTQSDGRSVAGGHLTLPLSFRAG